MYYGLTVRCAGLDGRINLLIAVVAYLTDIRRTISVTCHSKKTPFVLSAKRSGGVTNPLRRADILSYAIAFCGLLRRLFRRLRRTSQKAFRFSANSHARAAKRQFRAAYSITPHRDFSLSESVSPACGHIPSLSFLNRSCACEKA